MINDLWYKNAILYCLSVGTYMDANGDGIGDFTGLMRRLDYLHGLGITAIWLMPFQVSPQRDDGYDVADYYGVDPRYGTLGDFVEFTHAAEQRGIRVLIDLVVNHTSNEHPWFKEARRDPHSKYRDWYVWSKKKPANANTGMVFPGVQKSTWSYDEQAKAWYFHRFYEFQPDLNTSHPEVQAEILKIMGFWIRRLGVPHGCGAVHHRDQGAGRQKARGAVRHAPHVPRIPAMAAGRRDRAGGSQCAAGHRHGIFRRRRRPHAHDVQFSGQPAFILRARRGRYAPAGEGAEGDQAAPGDSTMGSFPAQSRRARSRTLDRGRTADCVRRLWPKEGDAALRPRHPPPPRADARRRSAAARTRLQPVVHIARDAGHPVRRRDRHGRRSQSAGAQLRAHADAMVERAAGRLHKEREAAPAGDQRRPLWLRAHQRGDPAAPS